MWLLLRQIIDRLMTNPFANTEQKNTGPLKGVTILDLSRILAGPSCTQLLGDLGAEIIKIERPEVGDDTRSWGPPYVANKDGSDSNESAYYLSANRNKRSVAVDISTKEGAQLVRKLAAKCDILIENFKAGGLKKYGLSYDDLAKEFPNLVYCSITGYGQTGPNAHRPGYDLIAQGFGGIMSLTGEPDGQPMKVAVGISDVMCGMYASTAILAALRHRDQTGEGQHIDIALVDTQVAWLINEGTNYLLSGDTPIRRGNQHPNIVPYQVFEVADGHVLVAVGNDSQFIKFCDLIHADELNQDDRFTTNVNRLKHRDLLCGLIAKELITWKKDELLAAMEEQSVPCGPINTLPEVFNSEQVATREMKITMPHKEAKSGSVDLIGNPIKLSKTPVSYRRAPPTCGADTMETIKELLGEDELCTAIKAGAIR